MPSGTLGCDLFPIQMGNVCGCVRAEKEEYYFDPAKAPFTPAKNSSGRKFFRRRKSDKRKEAETCDGAGATDTVAAQKADGYNPEDFFVAVSCTPSKSPTDGQTCPKHGSSIRSSVKDNPVPFPWESYNPNTKPRAQKEVVSLENFTANRQLSFPNIPYKLAFLPYVDAGCKRKASSLSSIDVLSAQWTSHINCFSEERCKSDVKGVRKVKSSGCVVHARYFTAGEIARASYTASLPRVPKEEQVHCIPSLASQVTSGYSCATSCIHVCFQCFLSYSTRNG